MVLINLLRDYFAMPFWTQKFSLVNTYDDSKLDAILVFYGGQSFAQTRRNFTMLTVFLAQTR
jgi:hypothetical protein